ncbi:MAG TPA: gluconate 2-dehydrogenase subunit 3 family protein [Steroidobacteraceae bacterium]|jgi:gluconate 2-dehydrogenase gamma chain|nr:gluconate 2-dehydrogenase subunit 3 family protein [Steroidobacteraceae bacterium]
MKASDDTQDDISRRSFLLSSSGLFSSMWVAAQWPAIAAAAHHADQVSHAAPAHFDFFSAADGADVEAVCVQIVPSGSTTGAREAHAVYFIDRSLATYFSSMAPDYRLGLADFQSKFRAANPGIPAFGAAGGDQQIAFLKTVDRTPFFEITRMLTVLGMFSSPKYGGNYQGSGWKMMGFVDQHAFAPPFGYYDAEYKGFVPYPAEKHV